MFMRKMHGGRLYSLDMLFNVLCSSISFFLLFAPSASSGPVSRIRPHFPTCWPFGGLFLLLVAWIRRRRWYESGIRNVEGRNQESGTYFLHGNILIVRLCKSMSDSPVTFSVKSLGPRLLQTARTPNPLRTGSSSVCRIQKHWSSRFFLCGFCGHNELGVSCLEGRQRASH